MTVYLRDFTFLSPEQECRMLALETRKCFDSFYPFQFLPEKGVGRIEFAPITIFYGGNGSGKSTMLNIIAAKLGLLRELPLNPSPFSIGTSTASRGMCMAWSKTKTCTWTAHPTILPCQRKSRRCPAQAAS